MGLFLIIALAIAVVVVIFSFQNAALIAVNLWTMQFQASLALVLLITLGAGILIGILVSVPAALRRSLELSKNKQEIDRLKVDLSQQLDTVEQQQKRIANLEKHLSLGNNP